MIGIDPGVAGAAAIVDHAGGADVVDLPMLRVHSKKYVDAFELRKLIEKHAPRLIVIELAGARRMQGVQSVTQTWLVYGGIVATALTTGVPIEIVSPLKWKRELGLIGATKEASRKKALRFFPALAHELRFKKHHNRAEGLLLAKWGMSVH